MESVIFTGNPRTEVGKKSTKSIRNNGGIPCVMYGGDDVIHFSTNYNDVKNLIYTPDFKIAEISIDGTAHKCILKEVQYHPVKETIQHIDFLKLEEDRVVKLEVPIRFKGVSPGVKNGGKLQQSLRRVTLKTTPDKIVDEVYVDISSLKLGQAARVRDIEIPEGIEIQNSLSIPVASVEVPRALRSATAGAEGEEEEAETEGGGEDE